MIKYYIFAVLSSFVAAISQMLLKKAANKTYPNKIKEYLNFLVIFGYGLMFFSMLLSVYAFSGAEYKMVTVLESFGYIFVLVFSSIIFKEKITVSKTLGNLLIILGVAIFCF